MLDAMLKGDGTQPKGNGRTGRTWIFGKKHPAVMESFQILAALEGRGLGRFQLQGGDVQMPRQTLRSNRYIQLRAVKQEDAGRMDVWCPTTAFGTWVMRQNGNVSITGNTRSCSKVYSNLLKFVARMAGFAGTPAEEMTDNEHEFDEHNQRGPVQQPGRKTEGLINEGQAKRFFAKCKTSGKDQNTINKLLKRFGFEKSSEITKAVYDQICADAEKPETEWSTPPQAAALSPCSAF